MDEWTSWWRLFPSMERTLPNSILEQLSDLNGNYGRRAYNWGLHLLVLHRISWDTIDLCYWNDWMWNNYPTRHHSICRDPSCNRILWFIFCSISHFKSSVFSSYAIHKKRSSTFQLILVLFAVDCNPITKGTRSFIIEGLRRRSRSISKIFFIQNIRD